MTQADALGALISPKQVAKFSAVLWAIGCVIGVLAIVLPHGPTVNIVGWVGLTVSAGLVSIWTLWKAVDQPSWVQYILSLLALCAVSMAAVCGHHSPVVYAVAGLYTLSSIYTASFYSSSAFFVYLVGQATLSGAALLTTSIPGAPEGWAVIVGTTTTVGVVVHVMQQALRMAATTDPLTGLVTLRALEPTVGRAWSDQLRTSDVLSRAGGDEFVLLLPSTAPTEAVAVVARLCQATEQGFSAGVAVAGPGSTVEEVLRRADAACYRAKQTGGGHVVVAEPRAA